MRNQYGLIGAFIASVTSMLSISVYADSLIEIQQKETKAISSSWTQQHIPAGMPKTDEIGNLRTSMTPGVSLMAKNVDFIFTNGMGFYIENLTASFEPLHPNEPVNMDDPRQFIIKVHSGSVVVSPDSLSALFNNHLLAYWPRPLNNMRIQTENQALIAKGGLRLWSWFPPIGWLPASLCGGMVLNQQDKIVYTPQDIRALGIPVGGLFRALGIKLSYLLSLNRQGAQLVGNSLVLDHTKLFPPPALVGMIKELRLDNAGLHLKFGDQNYSEFYPPASAPNSFIWIQSGDIKLFNTVVTNANILIKDHNDKMNLHFDLYNYREKIGRKNLVTMAEDGSMVMTLFTNEMPR